ncbi:MAG: S-layer homology domain-containing protein [Clostridiales bacterium]|nr:S-layer homology domain-containing protein [Clostridiales bacterium]
MAARGISTGTGNGNFSPQANLTRSMLVTILYRLENEPETNTSSLFRDVLPDLWYSDAVNWTSLS